MKKNITKDVGRLDQRIENEDLMGTVNQGSPRIMRFLRILTPGIVVAGIWLGGSMTAIAAAPRQLSFSSPEQATDALVAAAQADKTTELVKILGPMGRRLIYSGDPVADKEGREKFVSDYAQKHEIEKPSDTKALLIVGDDAWPFPIPLVTEGDRWRFDTAAGVDEILNRRIGRNELNAIQVCAAIADAEHDYASKDRTGTGYLEYAQKLMSDVGKRNGLYWPVSAGDESPIGPLVAKARAEGYGPKGTLEKRAPYHGYFYKILSQQGPDASGGAYSYVVNGHMIGGFALLAFPAKYGDSGVMTFMINQDSVVFEANLGRDTTAIAQKMTTFNPGAGWIPHQ